MIHTLPTRKKKQRFVLSLTRNLSQSNVPSLLEDSILWETFIWPLCAGFIDRIRSNFEEIWARYWLASFVVADITNWTFYFHPALVPQPWEISNAFGCPMVYQTFADGHRVSHCETMANSRVEEVIPCLVELLIWCCLIVVSKGKESGHYATELISIKCKGRCFRMH
jgi:hypothetical protein